MNKTIGTFNYQGREIEVDMLTDQENVFAIFEGDVQLGDFVSFETELEGILSDAGYALTEIEES